MTYGTDTIKKALGAFLTLGENVEEAKNNDGVITKMEVVNMAGTLLMDLFEVIPNIGKLKLEYLDMDDSEREALKDYFKEELNLEDDVLEVRIEKGWVLALALEDFISEFISVESEEELTDDPEEENE